MSSVRTSLCVAMKFPRAVASLALATGLAFTMLLGLRHSMRIAFHDDRQTNPNVSVEAFLSSASDTIRGQNDSMQNESSSTKDASPTWYFPARTDNRSCAPLPPGRRPPLEFIHIPKTGGSAIEYVAVVNNVSWGICHWTGHVRSGPACPPHPDRPRRHPRLNVSYWHLPPQHLDGSFDPYANPEAHVFVVVRHPYGRLVSDWNWYPWITIRRRRNATEMNAYLSDVLRRTLAAPDHRFAFDGHLLPQFEFVRALDPRRVHVLHMEQLAADFACLMRRFHLGHLRLAPDQRVNAGKRGARLTVGNLTEETKSLIRAVYIQDFNVFGYER